MEWTDMKQYQISISFDWYINKTSICQWCGIDPSSKVKSRVTGRSSKDMSRPMLIMWCHNLVMGPS
jgi:hypothetical protein